MKIIYHNDLDGWCSAAIAYNNQTTAHCELIEMSYNKTFDIESIKENEHVIILDFSFKPAVMKKILEITKNIIWIDHHKTIIDEYKKFEGTSVFPYYLKDIKGIRDIEEKGPAACELTWQYFEPVEEIPEAVKLIGDRDSWRWEYGEKTAHFCVGMDSLEWTSVPNSGGWEVTLTTNFENLRYIIERGKISIEYRDKFCKEYCESFGFETEFDGHDCFVVGVYKFGSELFGDKIKQYPLCLSFEYDGKNWTIGLYSESIDVSEIAVSHGGGGHKGAAGFTCKELPFQTKDK